MARELEFVDGEATMAYAGETPWHGLGKKVPNDLTPDQMMEAANLNWEVKKFPLYANVGEKKIRTDKEALIRTSDNKVLDVVGKDWTPVQNKEAFEFFTDFIAAGDMEMHTAGSLKDGQRVWALAKIKESFDVFGGDQVDSYLLFSNPHKYGQSVDVRFTPIRVVCNNTLTIALGTKANKVYKVSHKGKFDSDLAKGMLGLAHEKFSKYKEMAEFLGSKRYTVDSMKEYFDKVFPTQSEKKESRLAERAREEFLKTQPGVEYAEGSYWELFNCVTYMQDHIIGRSTDNRLSSSWFGTGANRKLEALELALAMAR